MPEVTYTADMLPACIAAVEALLALCDALEPVECGNCGGNGGEWDGNPDEPPHACFSCEGQGSVPSWTCQGSEEALQALFALLDTAPAMLRMELARLREHEAAEARQKRMAESAAYNGDRELSHFYHPDVPLHRTLTARCWAQMQGREGK